MSYAVKRQGETKSFQFLLEGSCADFVSEKKENALLPNFVRRRGTSYRPLSVDHRCLIDLAEVGSTMSARYTGDLPLCMECISRHSLYCILQRIGSQCSWIRLTVTWSDAEELANDKAEWRRHVAQCSHLDAG